VGAMENTSGQVGNYIIKKELGSGGMGAVYLCEHALLGRRVALKVLHGEHAAEPSIVERFFNEARAVNAIHHPNIVDITDFGSVRDASGKGKIVYLVMELLEGKSLASAIPSLSIEQALHVTRQCCRALAASHARGIVHRDLKPENIVLVTRGDDPLFVKVVDFGIAKLMDPREGQRTQVGAILGTPLYMSPEQYEALGRVDHRADIYSLGVLLYEMLTKRPPFRGHNFPELAIKHRTQAPVAPSFVNPAVTPELDAIVLRALEKSPDKRFQDMNELLAALESSVVVNTRAQLPTQIMPQVIPEPPRPRRRAIAAAIATAAVVAGALGAIAAHVSF
jgi:eukaryotic-like serine/threonine-protein kinase